MSFRQSGRYGHVPPAQYGQPQPPAHSSNLRQQSSFDDGDDISHSHPFTSGYPEPGMHPTHDHTRSASAPSADELYQRSVPPPPLPPKPPFERTQPAKPAYQYPPQASATLAPISPPTYNPQQFANVYTAAPSPARYPSQSVSSPQAYSPPATYVPAAYRSPQRQEGVQSYPQSPTYSQAQPGPPYLGQHYNTPMPFEHSYYNPEQRAYASPAARAPSTSHLHSPLAPRPSPYQQYQSETFQSDSAMSADSIQRRPMSSHRQHYAEAPLVPTVHHDAYHGTSQESSNMMEPFRSSADDTTSTLQRHPTGRRLPDAPVSAKDAWRDSEVTPEELMQDQIYQDIEDAIMQPPEHSANTDLLDNELGDLTEFDHRRLLNPTGLGRQSSSNSFGSNTYSYDYDDDDSDLEAASGLAAMELAEQEDTRLRAGGTLAFSSSHQSQGPPPPPPKTPLTQQYDDDSDSDYAHVDMGLYGGGYDARLSYGNDMPALAHQDREVEDERRPLPIPDRFQRNSQSYTLSSGRTSTTNDAMPYEPSVHPFPALDSARLDVAGTGGLQKPNSRSRLSFDDGDESLRFTESRLSGRSRSESPLREDLPDMFYHPGISGSVVQRPLPILPSQLQINHPPELRPAGTYRVPSSYDTNLNKYEYENPDAYASSQDFLMPNGQLVPRSISLISHGSTPQVVPPARSRTDAEERQARQRTLRQLHGNSQDYLDGSGVPPVVPLDLPALPHGKRRKLNPGNLRSQDFKTCEEPWAVSGIAQWLREICGGETGEGESDLRQKVIIECLINLFTHKVPTMLTADAEDLSARLVNDMFVAGVLVKDEEWAKFGQGTISGVLWQMTGSGCYAPKLHADEIRGRCYSHHCGRTLKKLDLELEALAPTRKTEGWHEYYHVTQEMQAGVDKKEIQRQNALHEIIMSEDKYMDQLNVLRILYRDQLRTWDPPIIAPAKLDKFLAQVFGQVENIKRANQDHLLAQLKYRQQEQGPWVQGYSDLFREWVRKARQTYLDYAAGYSQALFLVRREAEKNLLFRQFLEQARDNRMSNRLDWNTYLFAPLKRLQQYPLMLKEVLKSSLQDNEEKANLLLAIDEINKITLECDEKVDEMAKKVELKELQQKLFLRSGMERVELNLDHLGRELIFKGDLQRAGANRFTWLETHAILFDNYLVLAKTVVSKDSNSGLRREVYDVSKLPIPMQLLVLESTTDEAVVKSKGLAVTTSVRPETRTTRSATLSDRPTGALQHTDTASSSASQYSKTVISTNLENDARMMFPFRVKHLGRPEVYTLYAPTAGNRADWCQKIIEAKERHAASLFQQNAEPFKLRVVADTAFAYDAATAASLRGVVPIRGTPLDRAIREVATEYGPVRPSPVCRAIINCATTFSCAGKNMVAIGTDFGIYSAEASSPRGWTRTIEVVRVTQITVLEEFNLCIIIADKSLIAYPLDTVLPRLTVGGFAPPPTDASSARRAPQKISGSKDVGFFATARMKDRTLIFYKKRENLSSTFKVLEPVFQKSSERRARLLGRARSLVGANTEFFRDFDEFYIPSETYAINLFHTYIAVATQRGFELLTLDRKQTMSIPDLKQSGVQTIAGRLQGQKPLGMFRLSDAEFLLCYEECGVYISRHGEVSRSVVLEFVGKARAATLFGAYLVLFDDEFVEVRNAENGRLRQIIAGKDVRCLDLGIANEAVSAIGGAGTDSASMSNPAMTSVRQRNLKIAMAHPENAGCQLVLELVLNSDMTV